MSARDDILDRIQEALASRTPVPHPGRFAGARPEATQAAVAAFSQAFMSAGGEVIHVADDDAAASWLCESCAQFRTASVGEGLPPTLRPGLPSARPHEADLGVSMARYAVAETGSLVLGSEDGRHTQILPPVHIVFVRERHVMDTLQEVLDALKPALPSAIGLHSGPSKSADIGQILVRGVHGPGRVTAVLIA
jgi:L-lactate dehydrogenase complex protein LldG